jgi:1-acyl-sn-glycerol-3-phosphate acyltransferase
LDSAYQPIFNTTTKLNLPWWFDRDPVRKLKPVRELNDGSWFFRLVVRVIRSVIELRTLRIEENTEGIPETGAAIVIAPHLTEFDSVIAPEVVTRAGRMPRILAKSSLWKLPVVKQAFNAGKLIPVERGTDMAAQAVIAGKEALDAGDIVFIFPEGTCSKDPDAWSMRCKTGAARLALVTGAPVIPIMQDGAQFLNKQANLDVPWSKYHHSGKPGKEARKVVIHTKVYEPLDFSTVFTEPVEEPTVEQIKQVNYIIEDALTRIIQENRGFEAPVRWSTKANGRISRVEEGAR